MSSATLKYHQEQGESKVTYFVEAYSTDSHGYGQCVWVGSEYYLKANAIASAEEYKKQHPDHMVAVFSKEAVYTLE